MAYKNEIQVQDRVSDDYESLRYVNEYSAPYQNSWFKTMTLLIDQCTITSKIFGFNPQQLLEHLNTEKQNS